MRNIGEGGMISSKKRGGEGGKKNTKTNKKKGGLGLYIPKKKRILKVSRKAALGRER